MRFYLAEELKGVRTVAIGGHVRPDGDCVGSCLAVYNYICENFPEIKAQVYLEPIAPKFQFLSRAEEILVPGEQKEPYDLFLVLDCGDKERLGASGIYFDQAKRTLCIDHHISNQGFAEKDYIVPEASSTCELVYGVMEEDKISKAAAEALYLGIVHDTGVFQYSCTSEKTMQIAGRLMSKGIDFTSIVDDTFYKKTYAQNQILGKALMESRLFLDGKVIASQILKCDMESYGVKPVDLDGIVSQLRVTEGIEAAIFLYETANGEFKVSMRANDQVNVSQIASCFGGGGHVKAAGCTMKGNPQEIIATLVVQIKKQLETEK